MAKKVAEENDNVSGKQTKTKRTTTRSSSSKAAGKAKVETSSDGTEDTSTTSATASTTKRKAKTKEATSEIKEQALAAAQFALEKKATRVKLIDLTQITSLTDYFVVASGDSDKQVKAIAENVVVEMREKYGLSAWRTEGWDTNHWVIIDFVDFVVHVFQEEARLYYNLERLYSDAPQQEVEDKGLPPAKRKRKTVTVQSDLIESENSEDSTSEDKMEEPKVKIISKTDKLQ